MIPNPSMKKLALRCAALAAALFVYRCFTGTHEASSESSAASGLVANATAAERVRASRHALEIDTHVAERAPGSTPVPHIESSAPARTETSFHGRLLDAAGHPLAGSLNPSLTLADADGRHHTCGERDLGDFAFSALPYGRYQVTASAEGFLKATDEIELDAAHAQLTKDYTLAPAPILKIRVVTPAGANPFDEELGVEDRPAFAAIATRELPGKWIDGVVGSLGNPYEIGRFFQSGPRFDSLPGGYMGILMLDQELPAFVSLIHGQRVMQTQVVKAGDEVVTFVLTPDELAASMTTVGMHVVDPVTLAPVGTARTLLWGGGFVERGLESDPLVRLVLPGREPALADRNPGASATTPNRTRLVANSVRAEPDTAEVEQDLDLEITVVDSTGTPRNAAFALGSYDPLSGVLRMDQQSAYVSTDAGELELLGLGHHLYVLRTIDDSTPTSTFQGNASWASGNVLLDLRPRTAPSDFVITLTRATRVLLFVQGEQADGLSFSVVDPQGLPVDSGRFYGDDPRQLSLAQGEYRFALFDETGQVLSEQSAKVGSRPLTVVLTR